MTWLTRLTRPGRSIPTDDTFDRKLIAPMILGSILNPVNSSMIAVALIPIGIDLGARPSETAWLVSALYLATAIGQPVVGRLVDTYGPRRLYLAGTATVILGGRRKELLDELAAAHPRIDTVQIDTADPASIHAAIEQVLDRHPDLDVLMAMAEVMRVEDWRQPTTFLQSDEEIVTTNLLGLDPADRRADRTPPDRPTAAIITVSSGLAFTPLAATPSYNASKAAVHMYLPVPQPRRA